MAANLTEIWHAISLSDIGMFLMGAGVIVLVLKDFS